MINHAVQTPSSLAWDRLMSKGYRAEKPATDSAHDYMMTQTHGCLQEELCCFVFNLGEWDQVYSVFTAAWRDMLVTTEALSTGLHRTIMGWDEKYVWLCLFWLILGGTREVKLPLKLSQIKLSFRAHPLTKLVLKQQGENLSNRVK